MAGWLPSQELEEQVAFTDGYEGTDRAKLTRPCKGGEGMRKMHCRIDDAPERARNVRSNGDDAARAVCVFLREQTLGLGWIRAAADQEEWVRCTRECEDARRGCRARPPY